MRKIQCCILLVFLLAPAALVASTVSIDFEGLADGTLITNQYPGVIFSNAITLTAGISLNEFEFPPRSGTNVASDNGGPLSLTFATPVQSFSGYFTYAVPLTLRAFDSGSNLLGSVTSLFSNNEALSGVPGGSPNELLQLSTGGAIARITITGDLAGGSFAADDLTATQGPGAVPEPSTFILMLAPAILVVCIRCRRWGVPSWRSRCFLAAALFGCFVAGADAAQSVGVPVPSPDAVYVNEPAVVTVVTSVASDPALIPNSITLVRVNSSGQTIANLGQMYDDGTHGDATAGDGNFTATLTFNEPAVASMGLMVTAAYRGQLLRVRSGVAYLPAVVHPTVTEVLQVNAVQSAGAAFFASRRTAVGDAQAILDLIAYLKTQPGVQDAAPSEDNSMVGITYTNGLSGGIYTTPVGTQGSGASAKALMSAAPLAATVSIDYPGIDKALVLAPFFSQSGLISPDKAFPVATSLSSTCTGSITPVTDSGVTVAMMKTWPQYGVVFIDSHGGLYPGGPTDPNGQNYVVVSTGQTTDAPLSSTDAQDWAARRIVPGRPEGAIFDYWAITPRFIAKYGQGLKKTIVNISACDSTKNTTMAAQFLANGVGAYLGFNTSFPPTTALPIETSFFNALTNLGSPASSRTVDTAFANSSPGSIFNLYPAPNNIAMCGPPSVHLNPFGNHDLASAPGPYNIEAIKVSGTQVTVAPVPNAITVTTQRVVNSACRGTIFSTTSSATILKDQTSTGLPGFVAGRDPFCNTLPITTTWTILSASMGATTLDLSTVPPAQLSLSVVR